MLYVLHSTPLLVIYCVITKFECNIYSNIEYDLSELTFLPHT